MISKQVEDEYKSYNLDREDINSLEKFLNYLQVTIADFDEIIEELNNEKRSNHLLKLEANIRNFFFFIFEQEEVEYYDDANDLLDRIIGFNKMLKSFFESIKFIARDYNYERLLRFSSFLGKLYDRQVEYYHYLEKVLDSRYRSFGYYNPNYQDYVAIIVSFYYDHMNKFEEEFNIREGTEAAECLPIRVMKSKFKGGK